jgi:acetyl-CoA C-acetyltransferase/acetyl-CoA acyltransferase 2
VGSALQYDFSAVLLHRHIGLKAGLPIETTGLGISCLCGTGIQSVATAAQQIQLGLADVAVALGVETMDQLPYHVDAKKLRWGVAPGDLTIIDGLFTKGDNIFADGMANISMPLTAENIVAKYGISRQEQDEFALRSHQLAKKAIESGRFAEEIVGIEVKEKKSTRIFDTDEGVRDTTLEQLSNMRPAFKKDGTVTAGNASGINNGAAALVLASAEAVEKYGLKPLAKYVSNCLAGCEPTLMGMGPVPSINGALKRAELTIEDLDLIEINEAFAGQYLGCERELGLDRDKVNVNGGGIALGHPIAATGIRIILTLAYELRKRNLKYGVASLCIGGGQGAALIIENAK